MPERIGYAGSVAVVDGPTINFNRELEVGEYERHTITVAPGAKGTVSLGGTSDMLLLVIESSLYDKDITFTADPDKKDRPLDGPLAMAGSMVGLLGIAKVTAFTFTNGLTGAKPPDITVKVLIARSA